MFTTGTVACSASSSSRSSLARAQADRGDVAGEHQRRVADRLPARELQLVRAQHHRVAAELEHARLHRRARAGRGLLEQQRDRAALERTRDARGACLSASARSRIAVSSLAVSSAPVRKCKRQAECTVAAHARAHLEPLPRPLDPQRRGAGCWPSSRRALAGWEWDVALLQEVPPWWPPRSRPRTGADAAPRAHVAQRGARRAPRDLQPQPGPAEVQRRRLQLHPRARRRAATTGRQRLTLRPERRWAHGVRLASGLWVANLHGTTRRRRRSRGRDARRRGGAPRSEWADGAAARARRRLQPARDARAAPGCDHVAGHFVDHVYVAGGLEPAGKREVLDRGALSDHRPVAIELAA